MVDLVHYGPPDNSEFPSKSLGVIIYNELQKWDPNRVALIDRNCEEITYGQLFQTSVSLAQKLQILGVKPGDGVAIVAQNQWKFLATVAAAFFVGAKVNLLNHDYTARELEHFFSLCPPSVIFATTKTIPAIAQLQLPCRMILYDEASAPGAQNFDELLDEAPRPNFEPVECDPEAVALILTSSGTTGMPKSVQITNRNFRTTIVYALDPHFFDINSSDTMLGFLPFFHIFGIAVGTASLVAGAKLVILDKFVPDRFLGSIQDHRVSKLLVVPPILLFLVKSPLVQKYDLSSVVDVLCGAAALTKEIEDMVVKKLNVTSVRQIYGMTEITGAVTVIPKNVRKEGSSGKVTTTHEIVVCDVQTGELLGANQIGELRFKGCGVMKGYLGNVEESLEAFDRKGYLRSGDLGYYDDDGFFYIVDRLKEIIKYKGFQVSPAELENLLLQHSGVKDAGVVGQSDERAGEVAVAFVVKQPDVGVTEEELVKYVAENLSIQKHLYGGVRFVDEIPKSTSGKILRRKLKELLSK